MARARKKTMALPGETLGFARDLKAARMWPPKKIRRNPTDVPATTPFIVIPADPNDRGLARPLPGTEALHSAAVEVIDPLTGNVVMYPVAGTQYRLRAKILNLGAAPCYAGVVEFAIVDPVLIDTASNGPTPVPVFAIEGFVAAPGATVIITCRRPWIPADVDEASHSVVVHAYDPLLDPTTQRFNAYADRHVGRRDSIPDVAGPWEGSQWLDSGVGNRVGHGFEYRVVVTQTGAKVSVSIFRGWHSAHMTGTGTIANGQVRLAIKAIPPASFTDDVTLSLPAPDTLHAMIQTREAPVNPVDPPSTINWFADLHRTP
jgi:hypothetical protein